MAAGLGFKTFATGEVLTAADTNGYLMQGVWVFANAAARDAAVTSPQEGNFAYLKDTNTTTYYTGSAWTNLDTTGMVNPMTTTGDVIYSSSGSTPARLGIGTAGQVLQVNSGATAPEWGTAPTGGMTLISTTTLTGASVTLSSIPSGYVDLRLIIREFKPATDDRKLLLRMNGDSNVNRHRDSVTANTENLSFLATSIELCNNQDNSVATSLVNVTIFDYSNTTTWKQLYTTSITVHPATTANFNQYNATGYYNQTGAITSLVLFPSSGNFTSGTALLYGVK